MEHDLVRASGSLLQAWQLLSSYTALLVLFVIAGGLMWRMRTEARVLECAQNDSVPPVLGASEEEIAAHAVEKSKTACLASLTTPANHPPRRVTNGH